MEELENQIRDQLFQNYKPLSEIDNDIILSNGVVLSNSASYSGNKLIYNTYYYVHKTTKNYVSIDGNLYSKKHFLLADNNYPTESNEISFHIDYDKVLYINVFGKFFIYNDNTEVNSLSHTRKLYAVNDIASPTVTYIAKNHQKLLWPHSLNLACFIQPFTRRVFSINKIYKLEHTIFNYGLSVLKNKIEKGNIVKYIKYDKYSINTKLNELFIVKRIKNNYCIVTDQHNKEKTINIKCLKKV